MKTGFGILLAGLIAMVSGCGGGSKQSRVEDKIAKGLPVFEQVGQYKTRGGKPVRAFKIEIAREESSDKQCHLLLVVGEPSVPVSMPDASTIVVGGVRSNHRYLKDRRFEVLAASTDKGDYVIPVGNSFRIDSSEIEGSEFPMKKFEEKISQGVIDVKRLDKLNVMDPSDSV